MTIPLEEIALLRQQYQQAILSLMNATIGYVEAQSTDDQAVLHETMTHAQVVLNQSFGRYAVFCEEHLR